MTGPLQARFLMPNHRVSGIKIYFWANETSELSDCNRVSVKADLDSDPIFSPSDLPFIHSEFGCPREWIKKPQ
jgi:hypothetical protein